MGTWQKPGTEPEQRLRFAPYPFQSLPVQVICKVPVMAADCLSLAPTAYHHQKLPRRPGAIAIAIRRKCPAACNCHWEATPTFPRQRGVHIWGHLICTLHGWSLERREKECLDSRLCGIKETGSREVSGGTGLNGYLCSINFPYYPPNDPDTRSSPRCARTKQGCMP